MIRIRFRTTTASAAPGVPFQAGQMIDVETLTDEIRGWLRDGRAELVSAPVQEAATLEEPEQIAVAPRSKGRGSR